MKKILINTGKQKVKDVIEPLYIESSFVQVYSGVNEIICKINSLCAMQLLYWIMERMNKYNTFSLNKVDKQMFIYDSGGKYSISGVSKALAVLKKNNIIASTNEWIDKEGKMMKTRNGMYYVNPNYFWKNPKKNSRIEMIKTLELEKQFKDR